MYLERIVNSNCERFQTQYRMTDQIFSHSYTLNIYKCIKYTCLWNHGESITIYHEIAFDTTRASSFSFFFSFHHGGTWWNPPLKHFISLQSHSAPLCNDKRKYSKNVIYYNINYSQNEHEVAIVISLKYLWTKDIITLVVSTK